LLCLAHSVLLGFWVGLSWPLTGRSEEMRAVEAAILASDVSGIVICGAAGVGKSRIARDALSAAVSRGCEGRRAVGTSVAKTLPLGALTAWAHSGVTDTAQLVRGVIESLTAAPAGTTVVVFAQALNSAELFFAQALNSAELFFAQALRTQAGRAVSGRAASSSRS
jgi:hypothetical protein